MCFIFFNIKSVNVNRNHAHMLEERSLKGHNGDNVLQYQMNKHIDLFVFLSADDFAQ